MDYNIDSDFEKAVEVLRESLKRVKFEDGTNPYKNEEARHRVTSEILPVLNELTDRVRLADTLKNSQDLAPEKVVKMRTNFSAKHEKQVIKMQKSVVKKLKGITSQYRIEQKEDGFDLMIKPHQYRSVSQEIFDRKIGNDTLFNKVVHGKESFEGNNKNHEEEAYRQLMQARDFAIEILGDPEDITNYLNKYQTLLSKETVEEIQSYVNQINLLFRQIMTTKLNEIRLTESIEGLESAKMKTVTPAIQEEIDKIIEEYKQKLLQIKGEALEKRTQAYDGKNTQLAFFTSAIKDNAIEEEKYLNSEEYKQDEALGIANKNLQKIQLQPAQAIYQNLLAQKQALSNASEPQPHPSL